MYESPCCDSIVYVEVKKLLGFGPECQNGGTRDNLGNCSCPDFFKGSHCEVLRCFNGGKDNGRHTKCICPDSNRFRGNHCEQLICDNNGKDNGKGYCDCVGNWYTGRFCEEYSSPWAIVFGVLAGILVILIILCIFCRLRLCRKPARRRSRRGSTDAAVENGARPRNNRRITAPARNGRNAPRDVSIIQGRYPDGAYPDSQGNPIRAPIWPPWPQRPGTSDGTALIEEPPPYEPKLESPPPSYNEVIKDITRFPSIAPVEQGVVVNPMAQVPPVSVHRGAHPPPPLTGVGGSRVTLSVQQGSQIENNSPSSPPTVTVVPDETRNDLIQPPPSYSETNAAAAAENESNELLLRPSPDCASNSNNMVTVVSPLSHRTAPSDSPMEVGPADLTYEDDGRFSDSEDETESEGYVQIDESQRHIYDSVP